MFACFCKDEKSEKQYFQLFCEKSSTNVPLKKRENNRQNVEIFCLFRRLDGITKSLETWEPESLKK